MSIDALIGQILGDVRGIAQDVMRTEGVRIRTATVTKVRPLHIRYDGEADASVVSPRRAAAVAVGDRVVVAKTRGQATVLGVLGVPEWQPLTVLPGFKAQPGSVPRCRIENGRVRFRGGIDSTGLTAGAGHYALQVPPACRPTSGYGYGLIVSSSADATAMAVVESDGKIQLRTSSRSVGSYYLLDQLEYEL